MPVDLSGLLLGFFLGPKIGFFFEAHIIFPGFTRPDKYSGDVGGAGESKERCGINLI